MKFKYTGNSKLTSKQEHYIECLFIDLGLNERKRKLVHIQDIIGYNRNVDELTTHEASLVISKLKEWKERGDIPR